MLNASNLRKIQPRERDFKLFDGGGLYLLIRRTGHRGWRFKYHINGHEKLLSFGPYPTVTLARARAQRRAAKSLLADGIDPSVTRQSEKHAGPNSFDAIAREWYATFGTRWSASYTDHIIRRFERDIFPWIGDQPIDKITPAAILTCLKRVESRGTHETAHRLYQNVCWVFRHALATNRCALDPSAPLRGMLLPTNEQHLAAITDPTELGNLLRAIDAYVGSHTVRTALRLAPLVFVRPTELRAAEWSEFHFDIAEWHIPAHRMKMRVPHIVPLSTQAIALLRDLHPTTGSAIGVYTPIDFTSPTASAPTPATTRYVFPSPRTRTRPLSNVALLAALRRMGYDQGTHTIHGFRTTASTLLNEQGWRPDAIERQLAHGERNQVRAAYNHAQHLTERKLMMQGWANYLDELRARIH